MVAMRDSKTDQYGNPQFIMTVGQGIRSFDDEVNRADENNILHTHPEDFSLWQLGEFENSDGTFNLFPTPKILVQADQLIKKGVTNAQK